MKIKSVMALAAGEPDQAIAYADRSIPVARRAENAALLATLMRAPVRPFSRQYLLERCLPESEALERVVDTHIYNLRKKLEAAGISGVLVNVRGVGYRFRQP